MIDKMFPGPSPLEKAMLVEIKACRVQEAVMQNTVSALQAHIAELEAAVKELEDINEQQFDGLTKIYNWSKAYPVDVFIEPDWALAKKLLNDGGVSLDSVTGSSMRHVIDGVAMTALQALQSTPEPPEVKHD